MVCLTQPQSERVLDDRKNRSAIAMRPPRIAALYWSCRQISCQPPSRTLPARARFLLMPQTFRSSSARLPVPMRSTFRRASRSQRCGVSTPIPRSATAFPVANIVRMASTMNDVCAHCKRLETASKCAASKFADVFKVRPPRADVGLFCGAGAKGCGHQRLLNPSRRELSPLRPSARSTR